MLSPSLSFMCFCGHAGIPGHLHQRHLWTGIEGKMAGVWPGGRLTGVVGGSALGWSAGIGTANRAGMLGRSYGVVVMLW